VFNKQKVHPGVKVLEPVKTKDCVSCIKSGSVELSLDLNA
jgi:hypothetical protein